MKKVKSIFMKPTILLGIAAVLLLGSGVGSARAALTYYSDQYSASMDMSTIGVSLKENGKTVILILHDLNQALSLSDRLVVMQEQKIVAAGTPDICIQSHILEEVFHASLKQFHDKDETYYFFE